MVAVQVAQNALTKFSEKKNFFFFKLVSSCTSYDDKTIETRRKLVTWA